MSSSSESAILRPLQLRFQIPWKFIDVPLISFFIAFPPTCPAYFDTVACVRMRSETGWKMTHLYDTEEPNVISQDLLKRSVLVQGPDGEAGRLAKEEGIEFIHVRHLRLDFQSKVGGRG